MHASGQIFDKICLKALLEIIPSVGHPNLFITKTLRRVLDMLTEIILKIESESIFFQINKVTTCKFKDKKRVGKSLDSFQFQGKENSRT